jgi:poly(A) polymerase
MPTRRPPSGDAPTRLAAQPQVAGPPRLDGQPWLEAPALRLVFNALAAGGHEARAVGGAVRNALLGRPIVDVDLATPALPDEVMRLAVAAGLHAVPTGIEHGTVTVVARHVPYEVTTLRRDIETFGRRARVTFSTDWAEDARRRDFTINALYCAADGTVNDPLGGWPDLAARRVRFIGDAAERIREDYLRILRFFRFNAEYAEGEPDAAGLAACVAGAPGLDGLSGERLRAELLKLVAAPRVVPVVAVMARSGLLDRVIGHEAHPAALAHLVALDGALGRAPDAALRLAALAVATPADAEALRAHLKLSNAEAAVAARAARRPFGASPDDPDAAARRLIYEQGTDAFTQAVFLAWARSGRPPEDGAWRARLALAGSFPRPVMPVQGRDLIALGVPPGPEIGRLIAAFESWWIEAGFPSDPAATAARLRDLVRR